MILLSDIRQAEFDTDRFCFDISENVTVLLVIVRNVEFAAEILSLYEIIAKNGALAQQVVHCSQ